MVGKAKHTQSICTNPPDLTRFMAALQVIPGMVLELNVEKKEKTMKYYNNIMHYTLFISTSHIAIHCNSVVSKLHMEP